MKHMKNSRHKKKTPFIERFFVTMKPAIYVGLTGKNTFIHKHHSVQTCG